VANKYSMNIKEICEAKIDIVIAKKKLKLLVIEEVRAEIIIGTNVFYIYQAKIDFETMKI
jgi:hypothetical protein